MIRIIITSLVFACLVMCLPTVHAEEHYEFTKCVCGTFTLFHQSKELPFVGSWAESGITMSDDKRFNNVTIHCEGAQIGIGQNRKGYGLCKATDIDGDMMIFGGPYTGPGFDCKFMAGTGKWKGIKGTYSHKRLVYSKPGKEAMPGTYQGCHKVTGTFELPPK